MASTFNIFKSLQGDGGKIETTQSHAVQNPDTNEGKTQTLAPGTALGNKKDLGKDIQYAFKAVLGTSNDLMPK